MFFLLCDCSYNGQYQPDILSGQYGHVAYEKSKFDFKFISFCVRNCTYPQWNHGWEIESEKKENIQTIKYCTLYNASTCTLQKMDN